MQRIDRTMLEQKAVRGKVQAVLSMIEDGSLIQNRHARREDARAEKRAAKKAAKRAERKGRGR